MQNQGVFLSEILGAASDNSDNIRRYKVASTLVARVGLYNLFYFKPITYV